jgi:uncharacterized protein involved in exopolysaccharide biosynthesis
MGSSQLEETSSLVKITVEQREALDLNLNAYWQKLKRRWQPALIIFLLTVATTASLTTLLKKTYKAEGKLLFKQDTTASLIGVGEGVGELKPLLNNQTPLSTQKEIITSQSLIQQTIEKLKLENKEGKFLKAEDLKKKLDVKIIGGSDVIEISYKHAEPYIAADVVNTLMKVYIEPIWDLTEC